MDNEAAFRLFVRMCAENAELVEQFNRLSGSSLGRKLPPIIQAIDVATGKMANEVAAFMMFCVDQWRRLPAEAVAELEREAGENG